ncbi:MAG: response regulator [Emcibacter sp.]|nr:response regulator [Emcibacter sp.]
MLEVFEVESVRVTTNNEDAIAILGTQRVDCIFVDNMNQKENGLELTRHIRHKENNSLRKLPIILCTAFTGLHSITHARDAGVTEVLAKPVSPDQIMEKMENALFNKRNFVDLEAYAGPDRRRRTIDYAGEDDRRHSIDKLPPKRDEQGD